MAITVTQLATNKLPAVGRKWRRPKVRFQLETRPYQIQPFCIFPVLPGDTLKKGMMQSRVVTNPIVNPLVGWFQEYYWFYVKLTDLHIRDEIPKLFMTEGYALHTDLNTVAADPKTFHAGGGPNWTRLALRRIVEEYFRDEGEAWDVATLDGLPLAHAFGRGDAFTDSLIRDDDAPEIAPDYDEEGKLEGEAYAKWQQMRKLKFTNLTFEEFLEQAYGVAQTEAKPVNQHRPELLRYVKDWQYPSNTVNPSDGTPSSAVSWTVLETLNKSRFFAQPGFVVGVTVSRPKVYMKNQAGSATSLLTMGERWLPGILLGDEPHTSVVNVPVGTGPLPTMVDANTAPDGGYWLDLADLLMYGEDFRNFAGTTTGKNLVSLPTSAGLTKYVPTADIDALFKNAANNKIIQDGVVDMRFLSRLTDTTK